MAKAYHLDDWLLNGGPRLLRPEPPDLRAYLSDGNPLINNLAVVITPNLLTAARRADYNQAFSQWKFYKEEYNREDALVAKVMEFFRTTTSPEYGRLYCRHEDEPPAWYATLKAGLAITEQTLEDVAHQEYLAATATLTKPPKSWSAWVDNWVKKVGNANQKNVAQALRADSWFRDLKWALRNFLAEWFSYMQIHYQPQIDNNTLTIVKVAGDLRNEIANRPWTRKRRIP
jgi:primosomal protein N'